MLYKNINCIIINTGNLMNSKELKTKAMQSPTEEVSDGISNAVKSWIKTYQEVPDNDSSTVQCISSNVMKVSSLDRSELKVSVKVFLDSYSCEDLKSSITKVTEELDVDVIDSVVLALPHRSASEKFNLDDTKPLWQELETFIQNGKVLTLGVSDLDASELSKLYEWAEVKPRVNQVNLDSCCVMPPEMISFAKEHDIQLLTHNDSKVLLPDEMFHEILKPVVTTAADWKINWIARYWIVVKCRGIIQNKGYIIQTRKTTEN